MVDELFSENKKTIKKNFKESTKKSYQDKKTRGDEYEEYIAEHYRNLGCDVIEYGKEKGVKDGGIDLIAKLGNEVILIQCKDWNENYSHKIDHKDIKVLRTDANDFLEKNPIYKNCGIKLKYTLSGNFLHKSAEKYMEECKEDISYEIIKPTYRKFEQAQPKYSKKLSRKKKRVQATYTEKIIIGVIAILIILFIFKPKYEIEEINHPKTNKNIIFAATTHNVIKNEDKRKQLQIQKETNLKEQKVKREKYQKEQKIKMTKYKEEERKNLTDRKRYTEREKVFKTSDQKTVREKAKEKLLIQMQN